MPLHIPVVHDIHCRESGKASSDPRQFIPDIYPAQDMPPVFYHNFMTIHKFIHKQNKLTQKVPFFRQRDKEFI